MSRFNAPVAQSSLFASKVSFDALEIESAGEETDEELTQEEPAQSQSDEPAKPTKSALKKASRLAREERRRREKEERARARQSKLASPSTSAQPSGDVAKSSSTTQESPLEQPTPPIASEAIARDATSDTIVPPPVSTQTVPILSKKVEASKSASNGNGNGHSFLEPVASTRSAALPVAAPEPRKETASSPAERVTQASAPSAPVQPLASNTAMSPQAEKTIEKKKDTPSVVVDEDSAKKRQNVLERVVWTFIMIFGFIGLLLMGHVYMVMLVMLCQTLVYREVTALFSLPSAGQKEKQVEYKGKDPWSKTLNWYFFAVTNYFLYGESIIYYFKHVVFADARLTPFATNHRMTSFVLYIIGFMGFVASLKKGHLKQQFGLFCWVHMSLLIIVFSSHFIVNNILEGLIWFWVPASLVICNDCFAYIWGKTLGRTPLFKLSPKKTVEGFVGAFFSTIVFGLLWGTYFMRFSYMICPVHDLGTNAFTSLVCTPNPVFVWRSFELWQPVSAALSTFTGQSITSISYAPYQLHVLLLSCFASLVAPFGGFFASGFKRAFDIKDFGHSIPGHGGLTDRMDCQFLMGVFTYVYYSSFIRQNNVTVGGILQTIVSSFTVEQQLQLVSDLKGYLEQQGIAVP